jgi:Transposase domain (DUF772)
MVPRLGRVSELSRLLWHTLLQRHIAEHPVLISLVSVHNPLEYILRALLLQVFYSVRSERLLLEQIDYNLVFRWFVGFGMDDAG